MWGALAPRAADEGGACWHKWAWYPRVAARLAAAREPFGSRLRRRSMWDSQFSSLRIKTYGCTRLEPTGPVLR